MKLGAVSKLAFLVLLAAAALAGCGGGNPIERRLARADELLSKHNVARARAEIDIAIAADPRRSDTYLAALALYSRRKLHQDEARIAEEFLSRARSSKLDRQLTDDEKAMLCVELGFAYWELRDLPRAERALEEGLGYAPRSPRTLNALGYFYADEGIKLSKAEKLTREAVALAPESGDIIDSLGWVQYKRGNYPAALKTLREAVRIAPNEPELRYHLAATYAKLGRKAEARIEVTKSLLLDRHDPKALALRRLLFK